MKYQELMNYGEDVGEKSAEIFANTILAGTVKVLYNHDMTILWANDYFFEMLGYTREEYHDVHKNKLASIIYKEDLFMLMAGASRWFDDTNKNVMTIRYVHKSGKTIWVKISSVLTDEYYEDKPVVYNIITDVTVLKEYEQALTRQTGFLKSLLDSSLIGLIQYQDGKRAKFIYSNDMAFSIIGYTREEYLAKHGSYMFTLISKEDEEKVNKINDSLILNGKSVIYEFRVHNKAGDTIWLLANARRCINQNGINVIQAEFMDVTSIKETQESLIEKSNMLDALVTNIPGGICIYELSGTLKLDYCNDEFSKMLSFVSTDRPRIDHKLEINEMVSKAGYERLVDATNKSMQDGKPIQLEFPLKRSNDNDIWLQLRASLYKVEDEVPLFYAVVTDITHHKTVEMQLSVEKLRDREQIEYLLNSDSLTGLLNRSSFKTRATEEIQRMDESKIYALIYSDINNFSYVNEHFGYEEGNRMLVDFAQLIVESKTTVAACRVFSDYFISLQCGNTKEEIINGLESRNREFKRQQKDIYPASDLHVSSGVYYITAHDCDITFAIDNANLARRKSKGKRSEVCGFYEEKLREKRKADQTIASEIYSAMQEGKIELFLQPKFTLDSKEIFGAEALVRWRKDDGTYRQPKEFIDVLESVGYIVELDYYVFEQVLINMVKWRDEKRNLLPISVNVSRLHNNYSDFVQRVCDIADKYKIDRKLLEIEITESAFSDDNTVLFENLNRLRNEGFTIDIDDFGVGYSSLSALMVAPVDVVKIDKIFVDNLTRSQKDKYYVNQICKLIDTMEKDIIFEGVETEEQAGLLKEIGYNKAQGYLFEKPIPVKEFEKKFL